MQGAGVKMQGAGVQNAGSLARTVAAGPFRGFPHYATKTADLTRRQANLLADQVGWVVQQHADQFVGTLRG